MESYRQSTLLENIKSSIPSREFSEKEKDSLLLEILNQCIVNLVKIGDKNGRDTHEQFMPPNKKLPTISIKDYLARLMKYSPCSKECFVASLLYMDRLTVECGLILNSYNIHRILITTVLISTKYMDDIFYNNEFYSQVGGISLKEMNNLELEFLKLLKFSAFCSVPILNDYQREIEACKDRYLSYLNPSSVGKLLIISPLEYSPSNLSPRRTHSPQVPNSGPYYQSSRRGSCDYDPNFRVVPNNNTINSNCAA
ncbi:cyclin-related 2 family protein [Tieghemostelium lacteum]|uniref:Cyclin-related 2 family protein n=1 Tax=Tieghemostelium lacteum TaxID=361077 RepID=A0A151ZG69_TIELA|nr:cyclin-related 2 family protein [Tieghemostelium lacteum]|eukprot:KYQ92968.1 cyclin-related 2 family protein [Tieghemostelium lacteum]